MLLNDIQDDVKNFVNYIKGLNGQANNKEFKTLAQAIYYRMCAYLKFECDRKYRGEVGLSLDDILRAKEKERPMSDSSYRIFAKKAEGKPKDTIKDVLELTIDDLGNSLKIFAGLESTERDGIEGIGKFDDQPSEKQKFCDKCLSDIFEAVERGLTDCNERNVKLDEKKLTTIRGRRNLKLTYSG